MAQRTVVIPICKLRIFLNSQLEQLQCLCYFSLLIVPLSLLEVVELDGQRGVDTAEMVCLGLFQFFLKTATD